MYSSVLYLDQDSVEAPCRQFLFMKRHFIIRSRTDYTTIGTPFMHLPNAFREQSKIIYHEETGESHVIFGYNETNSRGQIVRRAAVADEEQQLNIALARGPILLPLMSSVHAAIALTQPLFRMRFSSRPRHNNIQIAENQLINYNLGPRDRPHEFHSIAYETEQAYITRLANQREIERWTQDDLSLKNRLLARIIRLCKIRVDINSDQYINTNRLNRFCATHSISKDLQKDIIELCSYIIRRYPTTSLKRPRDNFALSPTCAGRILKLNQNSRLLKQ